MLFYSHGNSLKLNLSLYKSKDNSFFPDSNELMYANLQFHNIIQCVTDTSMESLCLTPLSKRYRFYKSDIYQIFSTAKAHNKKDVE